MHITIDRGNGFEEFPLDQLQESSFTIEDENEKTFVTEHRLDGLVVKRSAHVHLKKGVTATAEAGGFT